MSEEVSKLGLIHPEMCISHFLRSFGEDVNREGLKETPKRVVKAWKELLKGNMENSKEILTTQFQGDGYDQIIALNGIDFWSTCEHHLLPFHGTCSVAYLPKNKVVGLSKLARLVECFSRRLQIQERMTQQIASALMQHLDAQGAAVLVRAKHLCMCSRGVKTPNAEMVTSSMQGCFREDNSAKSEVLRIFGI